MEFQTVGAAKLKALRPMAVVYRIQYIVPWAQPCHHPNSISVRSAVFAQLTVQRSYTLKLAPYGTDGRLLLTANFEVT